MSNLPLLKTPEYELTIPSSGQRAAFRPFLVREEKILLMAMQSEDEKQVIRAVEDIIKSCLIGTIDLSKLSMFDIEYIFLKIRSKSIGEIVEMRYQCQREIPKTVRDEHTGETQVVNRPCGTNVPIKIHLDEVKVDKDPNHTTQIKLTDEVGLTMRYPNLSLARKLQTEGRNTEDVGQALDLIAACIESVFDADQVITEFNQAEMVKWLETLTQQQFAEIQKFFDTIPRLRHTVHFQCPACGHEQDIVIEGIQNFFG
jgi:hypothetical protein